MYKILDEKILAWKALSTENSSKATFQLAKKKRREEEEDEGWRSCRTAGYVTIKAKGSPLCSQDTRIGQRSYRGYGNYVYRVSGRERNGDIAESGEHKMGIVRNFTLHRHRHIYRSFSVSRGGSILKFLHRLACFTMPQNGDDSWRGSVELRSTLSWTTICDFSLFINFSSSRRFFSQCVSYIPKFPCLLFSTVQQYFLAIQFHENPMKLISCITW